MTPARSRGLAWLNFGLPQLDRRINARADIAFGRIEKIDRETLRDFAIGQHFVDAEPIGTVEYRANGLLALNAHEPGLRIFDFDLPCGADLLERDVVAGADRSAAGDIEPASPQIFQGVQCEERKAESQRPVGWHLVV